MVWRLIGSQSNLQVGECQDWVSWYSKFEYQNQTSRYSNFEYQIQNSRYSKFEYQTLNFEILNNNK